MNKHHLQGIALAAIVLFFAASNNAGQERTLANEVDHSIGNTSVEATVSEIVQPTPVLLPAPPADAGTPPASDTPEVPVVGASAVLVKELGAQSVITQYNEGAHWPLASLTKLMTALVAVDTFGPSAPITISAQSVESEGDAGKFSVGEVFTVSDLVKAMISVSSNDAAEALADSIGRSQFVNLMQAKAHELGLLDTTFNDPTGLSYLNQSTADDISALATYLYNQHPEILSIATRKEVSITERTTKKSRALTSINAFSGQPNFLGGKTGYTDEAKGNLVSLFSSRGKDYIIIVLGTDDRFGETEKLYHWLTDNQLSIH